MSSERRIRGWSYKKHLPLEAWAFCPLEWNFCPLRWNSCSMASRDQPKIHAKACTSDLGRSWRKQPKESLTFNYLRKII